MEAFSNVLPLIFFTCNEEKALKKYAKMSYQR